MIRFLHRLRLVKGIYLELFDGTVAISFKEKTPFGTLFAYRFPFTKTGYCTLLEDGTVKQPNYIKKWKDMD